MKREGCALCWMRDAGDLKVLISKNIVNVSVPHRDSKGGETREEKQWLSVRLRRGRKSSTSEWIRPC